MKIDARMILNTRIPRMNNDILFSSSVIHFDHYKVLGNYDNVIFFKSSSFQGFLRTLLKEISMELILRS